jgi:predicted esterase
MNESWVTMLDHGWVFSVAKPDQPVTAPPLILLHGLAGDENSLHALTPRIRRSRWIISLRGLQKEPGGRYAWAKSNSRSQADYQDALNAFLPEWQQIRSFLEITAPVIDLMGFSQGAALASLLLINYPLLIRRVAVISGFIPQLTLPILPDLTGHLVMISHGTQDTTIPFAEARRSADLLASMGAEVNFCQSDTRHKIGSSCLNQLQTFYD